jgi:hypothetical protein
MTTQTRPVRIDLQCRLTTLHYTHALPAHLITANPHAQEDPKWVQDFVAAIKPLVVQHEEDGKRASGEKCGVCGRKMSNVSPTVLRDEEGLGRERRRKEREEADDRS